MGFYDIFGCYKTSGLQAFKRTATLIILFSLMITTLSCIKQKYSIKTQFNSQKWTYYNEIGTGVLSGQAFLKTRSGDVKTCAGEKVLLMPYNDYTKEIYIAKKSKKYEGFNNTDPRLRKYIRMTICDAEGDFEFNEIPEGSWIVGTTVKWEVPIGYSTLKQGGDLLKIVETKNGKMKKVYLTGEDRAF